MPLLSQHGTPFTPIPSASFFPRVHSCAADGGPKSPRPNAQPWAEYKEPTQTVTPGPVGQVLSLALPPAVPCLWNLSALCPQAPTTGVACCHDFAQPCVVWVAVSFPISSCLLPTPTDPCNQRPDNRVVFYTLLWGHF